MLDFGVFSPHLTPETLRNTVTAVKRLAAEALRAWYVRCGARREAQWREAVSSDPR